MSKAKDGTHTWVRILGTRLAGAAAFAAPLRAAAQVPAGGARNHVPTSNKAAETARLPRSRF